MKSTDRVPSLDGWRGFSILLVIIGHEIYDGSRFNLPASEYWINYFTWPSYGVQIFFVISGYIITRLMIREEKISGSVSIGRFYLRRVFRIIPPLLVYMLAVFLLSFNFRHEIITPVVWIFSFLFMANFDFVNKSWSLGHLWSLSVEEQYYLFWPAIFSSKKLRVIVPVIFIIIAPVFRIIQYVKPGWIGSFSLFTHADAIFFGALFAIFQAEYQGMRLRWLKIMILSITLFCLISQKHEFIPHSGFFAVPFTYTLFSLSTVILIEWSLHDGSPLYYIMNRQWLVFIGRISYSLYLWQQLFYRESILGISGATRFPFNFILMFVLTLTSYKLVETPILKWRKKFSSFAATSKSLMP